MRGVAVSSYGTIVASASGDNTVKIWNAQTGSCLKTLQGHSDSVFGVAVSSDGTIVASASWDHTVKIWNNGTAYELFIPVLPMMTL